MNSSIAIFEHAQFGNIRVAFSESNDPLFCLADLCQSLSITNPRNVRVRLDEEDVRYVDTLTSGGKQQASFVTESGLYSVILRSSSPLAKPMQKWVTSEVLPSIRKHGIYAKASTVEDMIADPEFAIKLLTTLKCEREEKERLKVQTEHQQAELAQAAPKVSYFNEVLQSESLIQTNVIAKELGMSAISLNKILHSKKVIYQTGRTWVLYYEHQNKGYTGTKTFNYHDSVGNSKTSVQLYWTEKGRAFIHSLFKPVRSMAMVQQQVRR